MNGSLRGLILNRPDSGKDGSGEDPCESSVCALVEQYIAVMQVAVERANAPLRPEQLPVNALSFGQQRRLNLRITAGGVAIDPEPNPRPSECR
jgi:hypothetical protein